MVKFVIDIIENKYFLNKNNNNVVTIWIMLLIVFFLIFLNICFNYKYKKYAEYLGYIKNIDSSFKVVLYVLENEVSEVSKYSLLVDDVKYDFFINSISDKYYIIENKNYYEVVLNVELDEKLLIENNIVKVVFEKYDTTLYKQFKKGLKKWLS